MDSLPTLVLLAGAFAEPSCFDALNSELQKCGYPTVYATFLSLNPPRPLEVSTSQDAEHVRTKFLLPLLDESKDIILVVHSYGGIVGSAAAAGLSKTERLTQGKSSGILGLLYIAGNIVAEGQSLLQAVGGAYPPFIKQDDPYPGVAVISPVMDTLYNDMSSSKTVELEKGMIPHALAAFETPSGPQAWAEKAFEGRLGYVRTLEDKCNPLFIQDMWMGNSGVKWDTVSIESGHCPFISQPEKLAELSIPFFKTWAN
ncbi:prolyl aminopeptidase-like protein [Karstenula rhodostoma CBS 690.94]|uniref:Prolyl aminopeptidase-like protein n=1 Tax=Karstenula rhodostoma CBS 690.94 TaxID=1392251 RepID=A0A9P4UI06_9PLEO|nr:prolyl aminopeptidase-like protein [Karstenula rhodostoma CBS 690.94]